MTKLVDVDQKETWAQDTSLWNATCDREGMTDMISHLDGLASVGEKTCKKFEGKSPDTNEFELFKEDFHRDSVERLCKVKENAYASLTLV